MDTGRQPDIKNLYGLQVSGFKNDKTIFCGYVALIAMTKLMGQNHGKEPQLLLIQRQMLKQKFP